MNANSITTVILRCFAAALVAGTIAIGVFRGSASNEPLLHRAPGSHEVSATMHLRTVPIKDLRPGMRVLAENPELAEYELGESTFEAASWRLATLEMTKPNGGLLRIQLLRPTFWFCERAWNMGIFSREIEFDDLFKQMVGKTIELDMAEMGADGPATITQISDCPAIESLGARGRYVVTGTFCHSAANVLQLLIDGESDSIQVTENHLFWSVDRQRFVPAGELQIGEQLQRADGTTSRIVRATPYRGPPIPVYNLEVDAQHVYHVGSTGILVHNKYQGDEVVYALFKRATNGGADEIVYYGITDAPGRRVGQHALAGKDFDYMKVLTSGLNHHAARTLEGGLIRRALGRLDSAIEAGKISVLDALKKTKLVNLNRGRTKDRWIAAKNVKDLQTTDLWKKFIDNGEVLPNPLLTP